MYSRLIVAMGCCLFCLIGACSDDNDSDTVPADDASTSQAGASGEAGTSTLAGASGDEQDASTQSVDSSAVTPDGGDSSTEPLPRTDDVEIQDGTIFGVVLQDEGKQDVYAYRGIPYAAPPIGELRWKPPQPVAPWTEPLDCTEFSESASQPDVGFVSGPLGEDCLTLNVLTPTDNPTDRLPVMVWFHGGGYSIGSGNQYTYNRPSLPRHDVVLVSVNHRLGPIGLLAHPALSDESDNGVSGNYLFLDLIASLQWVQDNIAAFGGDPNRVTIFGESGGSGKTDALVASPLADGLFHRAIYESGANLDGVGPKVITLEEGETLGEQLVEKLGIANDENLLANLRALSADEIQTAATELGEELGYAGEAGTGVLDTILVDGWFMPDFPPNIFADGNHNNVPIITSANLGELTAEETFIKMPLVVQGYIDRLNAAKKLGTEGYPCIFSQVPRNWAADGVIAPHGLEVPYVFGALEALDPTFFAIFIARSGGVQTDPGLTQDDEDVSEAMMSMWAQFAATGDPNVDGLVTWPAWDENADQYLDISWPLDIKTGYSQVVE